MLEESYGQAEKVAGSSQKCKPDYETMITRAKMQKENHQMLLDAIFVHNESSTVRGKMAELVGELYSQIIYFDKRIAELLRQQEEDA